VMLKTIFTANFKKPLARLAGCMPMADKMRLWVKLKFAVSQEKL